MLKGIGAARRSSASAAVITVGLALLCIVAAARPALACDGDCDSNGAVTIEELVTMIGMALADAAPQACAGADGDRDGAISVADVVLAVNAVLRGCPPLPTPTPDPNCPDAQPFDSTFAAIEASIFARYGCAQPVCHGAATQGGLDLSPGVAYRNLIDVAATGAPLNYVEPGDKDRSYLWLKLAAKTSPDLLPANFQIAGAPMPNSAAALTADELTALQLWIYNGAPETGSVIGTEALLGACLPPPQPITIKPLDPPPADRGLQFVMPPWPLEAHSEHEVCFATYYDISDRVPERFRDPSGTRFRVSARQLRQDPQSHHLILSRYVGDVADIHHPSYGNWTCAGGAQPGAGCEPTDPTACGTGFCVSERRESFACIGFGPPVQGMNRDRVGGAQSPQSHVEFAPGVYTEIPLQGILYWNSHAFNVTDRDAILNARINFYYATDTRFPVVEIFDRSRIFAPDAEPFTSQTICQDHVLAQGARLFSLTSHTHKRGKHFTVAAPDGTRIYESFTYNDPVDLHFDPPLEFDSPDPAQRTLRYCSLYNNGENPDGSPNPDLVTRRSRIPSSATQTLGQCSPVACAEGQVGKPCNGVGDDRTCDTAPGAGDGFCDACRITGGESTENEMFVLNGWYYIAEQ